MFGEVGIKIVRSTNMKEKISNKEERCIFLGYEDNHPGDAYRVLDLRTKTVMITRDVRWLGKTYGEVFDTKISKNLKDTDMKSSGDDSDEEILIRIRKGEKKEEIKEKEIIKR